MDNKYDRETLLNHAARLLDDEAGRYDDDDTSVRDDLRATAAALRGACPSSGSPSSLPRRPVADAKVCPDCGRELQIGAGPIGEEWCWGNDIDADCPGIALARARRALAPVLAAVAEYEAASARREHLGTYGHRIEDAAKACAAALGPQKPAAPLVWERVTDREASTPLPIGMGSIGIAHETRASGLLLHVFAATLAAAKAELERIVRAAGLLPEAAPQDKEEP